MTDGIIGGLVTPHRLRSAGFSYHVADSLTYWYQLGAAAAETRTRPEPEPEPELKPGPEPEPKPEPER